jgi:predicted methyltransferase
LVQDITGRLFAISYELTNTRDIAVDVNALPTGIYFITLQGETEKVTHKFVKQ